LTQRHKGHRMSLMSLKGLLQGCFLLVFIWGVSLPALCYSSQCGTKKAKAAHACCHETQKQNHQFKNGCCRSVVISSSFVIPTHSELKELNQITTVASVVYTANYLFKDHFSLDISNWQTPKAPPLWQPVLRI